MDQLPFRWVETRELLPPVKGMCWAARARVSVRHADGSSRDVRFQEQWGKTQEEAVAKAEEDTNGWLKQSGFRRFA